MKMPSLYPSLATSILLALVGCNDEDSSATQASRTTIIGHAADGYLAEARVCLDINANKICDQTEPTTMTNGAGEYRFDNLALADATDSPLVVEVIENVTVDLDNPGAPIENSFTLTAPAGYQFVSPITTLVNNELNDITINSTNDAESSIVAKLGLAIDPRSDYIAAKSAEDTSTRKAYTQLHKVAQITAKMMEKASADFASHATAKEGTSQSERIAWINEQVASKISNIASTVTLSSSDLKSADEIITELGEKVTIDITRAKSDITLNRGQQSATSEELVQLVTVEGLTNFQSWHQEGLLNASYQTMLISGGQINTEQPFSEIYLSSELINREFVANPPINASGSSELRLTDNGWETTTPPSYTITTNNNEGQVVLTAISPINAQKKYLAETSDLSGAKIRDAISLGGNSESWSSYIESSAIFPSGSSTYELTMINAVDEYTLTHYDGEQNGISLEPPIGGTATTLEQLLSPFAQDPAMAFGPYVAEILDNAGNQVGHIFAELVNDKTKTVNFYRKDYLANDPSTIVTAEATFITSSNWEQRTINEGNASETLIYMVKYPPAIRAYTRSSDGLVFSMYHDQLHQGRLTAAGTSKTMERVFNQTANEAIISNFSNLLFCDLQMETAQPSHRVSTECPTF